MKTELIFLCALLGCGLVKAQTTTSMSQDKPNRLYVEKYTDNETGDNDNRIEYYDSSGNPTTDPYGEGIIWTEEEDITSRTINWSDGSGGSGSSHETIIGHGNLGGGTSPDLWTQSVWPPNDALGTFTTWEGEIDGLGSPAIQEHCDLGIPLGDQTGSAIIPEVLTPNSYYQETIIQFGTRHAQATMKLQTGGRSGSKLQNLFGFTASATQYLPVKDPPPFSNDPGPSAPPIPQQNIVVGSVGTMPATGALYAKLPDDSTVDVTPYVAGVDYYTFDVSGTKYHCYFTAYAEEPNPGGGRMDVYGGGGAGFGHCWWTISTDAPYPGLLKVGVRNIHYIGGSAGFFPINQSFWILLTDVAAVLRYPNGGGTETVHRKREIGIDGLIGGLNYTRGIDEDPGFYDLFYANCTTIMVEAADNSGVKLPDDNTPQNMGIDLNTMPPDDP